MKKSFIVLLLVAGGSTAQTAQPPSPPTPIQTELKQTKMESQEVVGELQKIASESKCITHKWEKRGLAPSSYIKGMGLVYARALCNRNSEDVETASAPVDLSKKEKDALAAYAEEFKNTGMLNDTPVNILRHNYALLIGLGMMESSGKYCEGRDVSQCFVKAENAEAGLFQTSYGAHTAILAYLTKQYEDNKRRCLKDEFGGSKITCKIQKSHNPNCPSVTSDVVGTGLGADWQKMTKACPAFAAEYAAVVLRKNGGSRGEFNPIRKYQAELLPECDAMLEKIQGFIESHPEACSALE